MNREVSKLVPQHRNPITPPKPHPAVAAWDRFAANNSALLAGSCDGKYLENRLRQAFSSGFDAAEQLVKEALRVR